MKAYHLTWSDEFNGDALDTSKWNYRTGSRMWSTQQPENVSVSNGLLHLALRKEEAGNLHYTGAGVISKQPFQYGYYEARLKTPLGAGWHTSFWMMLNNGRSATGQPITACQELDVIENDSVQPHGYSVNVHRYRGGHIAFGTKAIHTPDLSEEFHIYGCEFTPQTVKYYFDGELVQTVNIKKPKTQKGEPFQFELGLQNIWLTSLASSFGHTQAVDDSKLPAEALFDYVRFFAKRENRN